MARQFLTGIDLKKNELLNAKIQNLSTPPSNPVSGQIYFDTDTNQLTVWDGTAWVSLAAGGNVTEAINNAINALDSDDIEEGSSNLYYTTARAKSDAANLLTTASLTNITITGNGSGLTITAENGVADSDTDDLAEGTTNLYFTDERAQDAVGNAVGNGIAYNDSTGAISARIGTGLEFNSGVIDVDTDTIATRSFASSEVTTHSSAVSGVHGVTGNVVGTTDTQTISNKTLGSNLNAASSYTIVNLAAPSSNNDAATKIYVDTAISNLVDGAPALLDTLNEIANAINDDASFSATITTSIGEKVAKAGDTMTGALTLHADPTSNLHAATKQYVDTEIADAISAAAPTTKYTTANSLLEPSTGIVTWTVTHNLNTRNVLVQVFDLTGYEQIEVDTVRTNANTVTLSWNAAANVSANSYQVVVVG